MAKFRCTSCGKDYSKWYGASACCQMDWVEVNENTRDYNRSSQKSIDETNKYFKDKELSDYCDAKQEREDSQEW